MKLSVYYDGGIHSSVDRVLRERAKRLKGRECGSGQMIVAPYTRDIEFEFPKVYDANLFLVELPQGVRLTRAP